MGRTEIIGVIICIILLFLTPYIINRLFPPLERPETQRLYSPTNGIDAPSMSTNYFSLTTTNLTTPNKLFVASSQQSKEEKQVSWRLDKLELRLSNLGGGISEVYLLDYPAQISCWRKDITNHNSYVVLNRGAPLPILSLVIENFLNGQEEFTIEETQDQIFLTAETELGLQINKILWPTTNRMIRARIELINKSTNSISLPHQHIVIGSAIPEKNFRDTHFLGLQWYDGKKAQFIGESWFANRILGCFPGKPRELFISEGMSNIVWCAVQSRFFAIIAREPGPAPQVMATTKLIPNPYDPQSPYLTQIYTAAFVHPPLTIEPSAAMIYDLEIFIGPKEYKTLAALGRNEDLAMNFTTFFGWFARALLLSMNGLHKLGLSYGLTIIAITFLIKLIFWPLTAASIRSMKRMAALQPQIKEIQEKYKNDPKKMNEKLMQFMRENRVNPMGGCLPILIQIPVFIGFYQMLQSAIELRGARFLWICDLSQPDTIATVLGFPINPLPLIMGLTQYWQSRMTPPSPGMDPIQQKIFQYMPLIFVVILYNFPAGLALYWTMQNLLSILQTKITRMHENKVATLPISTHAKSIGPASKKKRK